MIDRTLCEMSGQSTLERRLNEVRQQGSHIGFIVEDDDRSVYFVVRDEPSHDLSPAVRMFEIVAVVAFNPRRLSNDVTADVPFFQLIHDVLGHAIYPP